MTIERLNSNVLPSTAYFAFEETRDPEVGMSPIARWIGWSFAFGDQTASVVPIHIPPGSRVIDVRLEISTAWTSATAVIIGDGTDDNGWLLTGVVDPTSAGAFGGSPTAALRATGKLYQTGDTLDISFAGIATAGTAKLFMQVISYNEALTAT